jgi:hypothetical protein
MHKTSEAAEAIICSFRSLGPMSVKTLAANRLAETWVQSAIAAGCDPHMRQESLSSDGLAGEWLLVVAKAGLNHPLYPGELPEELLNEVFLLLTRFGRVIHDGELKVWHGSVWPDDCSPRALAFRIRLARGMLAMDRGLFYGACAFNPKAGEALEAGHVSFASPDHEMLHELCACHEIPEEWLMLGNAEDIEA